MYVPSPVARPVQYEQEGHDANGHALASYFVGSEQMCLQLIIYFAIYLY